jgi:hypothetical protein
VFECGYFGFLSIKNRIEKIIQKIIYFYRFRENNFFFRTRVLCEEFDDNELAMIKFFPQKVRKEKMVKSAKKMLSLTIF